MRRWLRFGSVSSTRAGVSPMSNCSLGTAPTARSVRAAAASDSPDTLYRAGAALVWAERPKTPRGSWADCCTADAAQGQTGRLQPAQASSQAPVNENDE